MVSKDRKTSVPHSHEIRQLNNAEKKLFSEAVALTLLSEDDGGAFDVGGGFSGGGGWYYGFGLPEPKGGLLRALTRPFVDAGKVALAGAMDMTNRSWGLLKTVLVGAASIPVASLRDDLPKINAQTKARTAAIRNRFSDVFARVDASWRDDDLRAALFMFDPGLYVAMKIASGAKEAGAAVVNAMKGSARTREITPEQLVKIKPEKTRRAINRSQRGVAMRSASKDLISSRLNDIRAAASRFDNAVSLQDVEKLANKQIASKALEKLPPNERVEAEKAIVDLMKKESRKLYRQALRNEIGLINASIRSPEKSELVKMYQETLAQLGMSDT